jgi:hypothetical protein
MVSSLTIDDIIHQISAADIPAQPTSALDLAHKAEALVAEGGGLSGGATAAIIGGIVAFLIVLTIVLVKVCRH